MNLRILNLISGVDKTKFIVQHESYNCKCGKNESVFNSKQKWNSAECRCEYKEIDDWGSSSCDMDYMCNPSTCDCESKKACKIDKYLNFEKLFMWKTSNC